MIKKTNYNICIFAPEIHDPVSHDFIKGIKSRLDINNNLDIISAGGLFDVSGNKNCDTYLYETILKANRYDGLIIFAGSLANFTTTNYSKKFLNFLPKDLPTICLSIEIPGYSFLKVDNYTPMKELVNHLIYEHNKKRIAFIKGPDEHIEAKERFNGFKDALKFAGIALDDNLVFKGNYSPYSGSIAVKKLVNSPKGLPDAIVCSDDDTALGVYAEFKKLKIDILKNNIAVTGFDNMDFVKGMEPELTTIDQSLFLQGRTALEIILDKIQGKEIIEPYFMPKVIYRSSCGCGNKDFMDRDILNSIYDSQIPELSYHKIKVKELFLSNDLEFLQKGINDLINLYIVNNYNLVTLADIINTIYYTYKEIGNIKNTIPLIETLQSINFRLLKESNTLRSNESRNYHDTSSELARIIVAISKSISYEELYNAIDRDYYFMGIKSLKLRFPGTTNRRLQELEKKTFTKDKHINIKTSKYYNLYHPVATKEERGYGVLEVDEYTFETAEVITYQISRALYIIELFSELDDKIVELQSSYDNLKITKDLLIESEQLAKLGSSVSTFTHELNNPIGIGVTAVTHLQDKTSILKNKYINNLLTKSELEEYLEDSKSVADILYTNLERATSLIKVFKQIAVDQSSGEVREFNLVSYINEIIHSLSPMLKRTKHNIILTSDDQITIKSYPGIFSQIVSNLVQNSIIHGFENIDNGKISIEIKSEGNQLNLIYKDNGCGIDDNDLDKIFDSYYTTKKNKGGSGLGLAIIYELVTEKLNGLISCTSKPDSGTTFVISLPTTIKV